jgi:TM2 domain-containing membrane protein YozV
MLLLYWGVILGVIVALLNAVWRVVRALELIAKAVESIAAKK